MHGHGRGGMKRKQKAAEKQEAVINKITRTADQSERHSKYISIELKLKE